MDGAERIPHEQVLAVGQLAGERRVVGGLPRVEPRVLEHVARPSKSSRNRSSTGFIEHAGLGPFGRPR